MVCAQCGSNYAGRRKDSRNYYVCGSHIYRDGIDCTRAWHIRSEDIESAAFDCVERVLAADSEHTKRIVDSYNKWVESQNQLYLATQRQRNAELKRLRSEIENLTASLAAGVDPATVRKAINERAKLIAELESLGDIELPSKLDTQDLNRQAKEIRRIAKNQRADKKRSILRKYITAMKADPENGPSK